MKKLLIPVSVAILMLVSGVGLSAQTIPTASVTSENAYDIVEGSTNPAELSTEEAQKYEDTQKQDNGSLDNDFIFNGVDGFDYTGDEGTDEGSTNSTSSTSSEGNEGDMTWKEAFSHFSINMTGIEAIFSENPMDTTNSGVSASTALNLNTTEPRKISFEEGRTMATNYISNIFYFIIIGAIFFLIIGGIFKVLQAIFDDKKSTLGAIIMGAVIIFVFIPILLNFPEFIAWCGDLVNEMMSTDMGAW